ncbi:MAG: hypothetical protein IJ561_04165 [Ruminococcus sp.]|nr:hypothetical protein [Ruminococcus sp.]
MNENYINEALGGIRPEYIEEAASPAKRTFSVGRVAGLAAAFAVVLGAGAYAYAHSYDPDYSFYAKGNDTWVGNPDGYSFPEKDNGEEHSLWSSDDPGYATSTAEDDTRRDREMRIEPGNSESDHFVYTSAQEIINSCKLIVIAEYGGDEGVKDFTYGRRTYGTLKILQVLKGECDETVTLFQDYYEKDSGDTYVTYVCGSDVAPMLPGTRAIFCLADIGDNGYIIDGAYSGIYGINGTGPELLLRDYLYNEDIAAELKAHYGIEDSVPEAPTGEILYKGC